MQTPDKRAVEYSDKVDWRIRKTLGGRMHYLVKWIILQEDVYVYICICICTLCICNLQNARIIDRTTNKHKINKNIDLNSTYPNDLL